MIEQLKTTIHQAIIWGDSKLLRECFYKLKSLTSEGIIFSPEDIDFFINLLEQPKFLGLGGGWYFAMLFQLYRESLSSAQQDRVNSAMLIAYDCLEKISPELLYEAIEQAINSGEEMQMKECAKAISSAVSGLSHFPDKYLNLILGLLQENRFLTSKGAWHLLYILEIENWEFLSETQKTQLLPLLESSYSSFTDWMAWFVISEMLGEYFANEQAFQVLCRLKNIEAEEPRSLIPHGLEHIVKDSHDQQLTQKAYAELLQMKYDPSEQVRDEVNTSLQRIANRGIEFDAFL
ncbi:MAG: hypothetical protein RIE73_28135 [Coleofasciculus sp. C1-SOL-03]|jgi:hypothetical protein|uniref:hypothetical protein n=1 Tax=Coleofasciculus sp. C1-SOL-03 TaxID=3069522 RepID=UPI00330295E9